MKQNEIIWAIATNIIANIIQKLIENITDFTDKPKAIIYMTMLIPTIALIVWGVVVWVIRYMNKNEAQHVLGDIIRGYENTPIESPYQQLISATHVIATNEEREIEEKIEKQNKINGITQQLAEKFGNKILYSDLKKMVTERIS